MRLLFITDNFPPEVNAPATRTFEHCVAWAKQGVAVTIITCAPNFPQGKVYEGYQNKLYQTEEIEGVRVVRVWSYITANEGFIKRILDYISFAVVAFFAGLFEKTDVIVATSPQFFVAVSGFLLSVFKRKPWVFELRDLWPESIRATSAMKNQAALDWLEKLEIFLYHRADLIIPVTDAFKTNLINRGIEGNKIKVVTNGANLSFFPPQPKDETLLAQLGLQGKFVVAYIGTHGLAHSLDFVMRSIPEIKHPDLHFLFIGNGAEKKNIQQIAKDLNIQNVTFIDAISKEKIPAHLSIIDAALVPLKKSDTFKTVIPSKIFESSSMRKPILLGVDGQARTIIETHRAGLYFEPENTAEFAETTLKLLNDKQLYASLQDGCTALAIAYDREVLATKMLKILKDLISGASIITTLILFVFWSKAALDF